MEPLSRVELRQILEALQMSPREVLRQRDAQKLGFTGDEGSEALLDAMAAHPRLVQRPIALSGGRAVLARPLEQLDTFLTGLGL